MNSTKGYFDLVVKAYPAGAGDGVSSYITSLKPGDDITVKGCFTKKKIEANQYKSIGMIAGGSGLTPMLQVAQELLNIVEDETKLSLLFCNVTPADIYLKAELDELAELFPERFSVTYARQPHAPMCSNLCLPVWLPVWLRGCLPVAWWCAVHC
jgi:cytochrome-b5 reductase